MQQTAANLKSEPRSFTSSMPSLLTSVVVHIGVFFFCMTSLESCGGGDMSGDTAEQFRAVGIVVRDPADNQEEQNNEIQTEQNQQTTVDAVSNNDAVLSIDESPPAEITLPEDDISIVGAGAPRLPASSIPTDARQMVAPAGGVRQSGQPGLGKAQTSFFDIRESANRFAYLIDASGSMDNTRWREARSQLLASLRQLQPKQEFQISFYNSGVYTMKMRNGRHSAYYRATESNINAAEDFINSVAVGAGTKHRRALRKVISEQRPQVLFFLTDGLEPPLYANDLETLRGLNGGRTRIHCIEFGKGSKLNTSANWLQQLAADNDGSYRYRDVNQMR